MSTLAADGAVGRRRRPLVSPLTRRILAVNLTGLAIVVAGMLYLDTYRRELVEAKAHALATQGAIIAAALAETATAAGGAIEAPAARLLLRRLVVPIRTRARLFAADGALIADSRRLIGPGGSVQAEALPPPAESTFARRAAALYEWLRAWAPSQRTLEPYREPDDQRAADYPEVERALAGETAHALRRAGRDAVLTVAVPVQRFKHVQGALLLSAPTADIEAGVRSVRYAVIELSLIAFAATVLLSVFLAGTIARPIHRLAEAADRVRPGEASAIPDFSRRGDEIGDLSVALRDMASALAARIDDIERFAADVAHELRNPLSSLRSAVETIARVDDPAQQRKLIDIVRDDVDRLDRLISDISEASRIGGELARAARTPVDIGRLLGALVDAYRATNGARGPRFELSLADDQRLEVAGFEARLGQVFRNIIDNARSFSPPDGVVRIRAHRAGDHVEITIEDDGPGIPARKLETIFERFYSERPPGEKFGTHSGLGLSISRQIVAAHGGTIHAENIGPDPGHPRGARFVVRLPARP